MGVLTLGLILVLLRQPQVGNRLPVAPASLDVAPILRVPAMVLDDFIKLQGRPQRSVVARGTSIFREAIDHETESIELLLGVGRLAIGRHAPKGAAVFTVEEATLNIVLRTPGGSQERLTVDSILLLDRAQNAIGCRERPKQAGIKDGSARGFLDQDATPRHLPIPPSTLVVRHTFEPERQDIFGQAREGLSPQRLFFRLTHFLIYYATA